MAKLSIEVDTEKKTLDVTVDGKKFSPVSSIYIFRDPEGEYFSLEVGKTEEKDGLMQSTRLYASEKDSGWKKDDQAIARQSLQKCISENILK